MVHYPNRMKTAFTSYWNMLKLDKAGIAILAVLGVLLISITLFTPYQPQNISLTLGSIAPNTIISPRYIDIETTNDRQINESKLTEIANSAQSIYTIDPTINDAILTDINAIFRLFTNQNPEDVTQSPTLNYLSQSVIQSIDSLPASSFSSLKFITLELTQKILNDGIQTLNYDTISTKLTQYLDTISLSKNQTVFIKKTILHCLRPNKVINPIESQNALNAQLTAYTPKKTRLKDGDPIIYKGEAVSQSHLEILTAVNLYGLKANVSKFIGLVGIVSLLLVVIERFIYTFRPKIHANKKGFGLILVIILIISLLGLLANTLANSTPLIDTYLLIPVPVSTLLLSILISPHIALMVGTVISLMIATMFDAQVSVFTYLFISNCAACFISYRRYSRSQLTKNGYLLGLCNMIIVIFLGLFKESHALMWYISNLGAAFLNGVLSVMISLAILPYLEIVFRITTTQTLLDLSNLQHPLMKKLMMNAPGTYQHSLMVANLAENAAEAILADPILCRVGAYYHDIGKLKRPMFFTENQIGHDNPHDTLSPKMSQMIIASHTKDGVELAKKYRLPKVLQDIMVEHHGTSLVSFFYQKAIQTGAIDDSQSVETDFRYTGPKPQTKESGIIMLADSVEAALRSQDKPTLLKSETLINKIFHDKIQDDQLSETPLTLAEIHTIKLTFINIFKGIYHNRLNYNDELNAMMEASTKPARKKSSHAK